jgi:cytochrome c5
MQAIRAGAAAALVLSLGSAYAADGKTVYDTTCVACHSTGVAGAPKFGDKAAWAPRIATGKDALLKSVLNGKNAMPPKAGNPNLSEADIKAAIDYMVGAAK